jgi:peptidoglycan/LPS O-acetylase OafA/YrhL
MNNNFKISENTSIGLDLIRAISAQTVLIGHGISFMGIAMWLHPPNFPWIQEVAVVIFFLLSGLVITYSTFGKLNFIEYNFKQFFLERFSRIYTAYIPIIFLIAVLDTFYLYYLNGINLYNSYNLRTFILNLVMLQDFPVFQTYQSALSVTSFGTARPFWTLAVEWWIYMFFGWLILGIRDIKNKIFYYIILLFLSIVPIYNCVAGRGDGLGLFWVFGFAIVVLLNRRVNKNLANKSLSFFLFFIILAIIREYFVRIAYDRIFALFLGGALYFLIIHLNKSRFKFPQLVKKSIRWWADYSFSLYLLHYSIFTIIAMFKSLYSPYLLFFVGFVISNVSSMTVAYFTEMNHKKFKNYLFNIFIINSVDMS